MRILAAIGYIGEFGETDGAINTYQSLYPHFERAGIDLDVLAYGPADRTKEISSHVRVITHQPRVPFPVDTERSLDLALPLTKTTQFLKRQSYDLVQVSTPDPTGLVALSVAEKHDLPVIAIYHTALDQYAHIRFSRLFNPTIGRMAGNLMQKWLLRCVGRANLVLAPSEYIRNYLRGKLSGRVEILSRGIDTDRFHPRYRDRSDSRVRVLYVGRVAPEKNLHLLVKLLQPRNDIDLMVVGKGSYMDEMKQQLPRATFTGTLSGDDLPRAYASGDIFVFPSRTDTLGNVVLEANASGLPAIVTDSMGPRELVDDGSTGFVAKSDAQFGKRLDQLIADHDLRRRMGRAARRAAEKRSWASVFERLHGFYRELTIPAEHQENRDAGLQTGEAG